MPRFVRVGLRSLVLITHAIWLGGFTFYSTAVLWVLDDAFGTFDTGRLVTRYVTDRLNLLGVAAIGLWWCVVVAERRDQRRWTLRIRLALVAATTLLLIFLFVDHCVLDHHLDTRGRSGFYEVHSVYLIAATVQWAVNLALIPSTLALWGGEDDREARLRECQETTPESSRSGE